jgi:GH24 family phage-related lysozyme (muramidase)
MCFPTRLTICGKQYQVKQKKLKDHENMVCYGMTIHPRLKIEINTSAKVEQRKETLLHEVIHAISIANGINLKENQVEALSSGLYDTMKRNRYKAW